MFRVSNDTLVNLAALALGLAGGARAALGGDECGHGPDREEEQQARRAVEKLSSTW